MKWWLVIGSLLLVYHFWLLSPRPNLGPDLSYSFAPIISGLPLPWTWTNTLVGDGMGISIVHTLWTYPVQVLFQLALQWGIPFVWQMKYLALLPMLAVGMWGMWRVSKILAVDAGTATLIWLVNSYFLLLIDGGQLNLAIAICLIPPCFYWYHQAVQGKWRDKLRFGLGVWLMGSFDIRIIIILAIILGLYTLVYRLRLVSVVSVCILTTLVMVLLNLYWLVPLLTSGRPILPVSYSSSFKVEQLSFASVIHSLYLQHPNWYLNQFGVTTSLKWYFAGLALLAWMVPVLWKEKKVIFLVSLGLTGIFLAKGSQPPLTQVYPWLFAHIPGFNLFRDPSKFMILTTFSYALLIGNLVARLTSRFKFLPWLVSGYILFLALPVISNRTIGTFVPVPWEKEYLSLARWLSDQPDFFRTLWIPTRPSLGYTSGLHPSTEAFSQISKRSFTTNIVGEYELFNYLRSPAMSGLLDIASVRYIFYPYPDERATVLKPDQKQYYQWFSDWFASQSWLKEISLFEGLRGFELRQFSPRFFGLKQLLWVIGPDDTYKYLSQNSSVKLRDIGTVHVLQDQSLLQLINNLPSVTNYIVLNNTSQTDLAMAFLSQEQLINISSKVRSTGDDPSGWWSRNPGDFLFIRSYLNERYGIDFHDFDLDQGYVLAEGERQLKLTILKEGILYARALDSTAGGQLVFNWPGEKVSVPTYSLDNSFRWTKIGNVNKDQTLTISSLGSVNILNTLAIISKSQERQLITQAEQITKKYKIVSLPELNSLSFSPQQSVQYKTVNPTRHMVNISQAPMVLAFSDNFDGEWQLVQNNKIISRSFPLYGLINGFIIDKPGEYVVEFAPQHWVWLLLPVSVFGFIIIGVLICLKK